MRKYEEILTKIRLSFSAPVSNKIQDAYFVQSVIRALEEVDNLKGKTFFLGKRGKISYRSAQEKKIPSGISNIEEVISEIVKYLEGMTIWGHPNTQENVIPPTTIPSIVGNLLAATYNPNLIWDEYSYGVAKGEVESISIVSSLIGYKPGISGGVFTFGGTGANLYGVKIGLEKAIPGAIRKGIKGKAVVLSSEAAHYSKLNVTGWLGIGMENLILIPTNKDYSMNIFKLELEARRLLQNKEKIACILATMGTTDAFGIDDLKKIVEIRDSLVEEFKLNYIPHIHADAVIGWIWSVFKEYDFKKNFLQFNERTLDYIFATRGKIGYLNMADSIGVDFHKTGYAPYPASLFLVKKREDLKLISRKIESMPYLYQFGDYHPGVYTLECSRSGSGPLAVLANLKFFGREGYQVILGHIINMVRLLRESLSAYDFIEILNSFDHGHVTLFRIYPPGIRVKKNYRNQSFSTQCLQKQKKYNNYNRRIFDYIHKEAIRGEGVALSLTTLYHNFSQIDQQTGVVAIKSFIISPFTDEAAVKKVTEKILEARSKVKYNLKNEKVG